MCVCECACVGGTERCTAAESTGSVGCERAGAEETVWEQAAGHGQTDRRKGVWRMEMGGQAGRHTASPPRCPPRALLTLQVQPLVPPSIPALPRHRARIPHQLNPPPKGKVLASLLHVCRTDGAAQLPGQASDLSDNHHAATSATRSPCRRSGAGSSSISAWRSQRWPLRAEFLNGSAVHKPCSLIHNSHRTHTHRLINPPLYQRAEILPSTHMHAHASISRQAVHRYITRRPSIRKQKHIKHPGTFRNISQASTAGCISHPAILRLQIACSTRADSSRHCYLPTSAHTVAKHPSGS